MNEEWKIIECYPEYEISTFGRVRSIDRVFENSLGRIYHKKGQILSLKKQTQNGYTQVMVSIWSNKKMYRLIVARLVAKTFIPNPNNYDQVNHRDEDSTNNFIENLEWCDCKYNINYKDLILRRSKHRSRPIDVYDSNMNYIETVSSGVEASQKYNVSRALISGCCNNQRYFAKRFHFQFSK